MGLIFFKILDPEAFNLDRKTATKEDVKNAFRRLSKRFHPDTAQDDANPEAFNKLKEMRDALLISLKTNENLPESKTLKSAQKS